MEVLKLFNIARSNTTNVHPPDMVDVSKLVDLVHEIAEQNIIQTRYFDDAQKLMLSIRNLMPVLRNRMDLMEDVGPRQPQTRLTVANSKLEDLMQGRRAALLLHWDLKYEMLELVPYWNDEAVDMMVRNLPGWSSSNHRLLLRKSPQINRDPIASRDWKCATEVADSVVANSTNI